MGSKIHAHLRGFMHTHYVDAEQSSRGTHINMNLRIITQKSLFEPLYTIYSNYAGETRSQALVLARREG